VTRDEVIRATSALVDEGVRLEHEPSMPSLRTWLQRSDDLLSQAWGSMDRYHLAWLMVGKPKDIVRGRPMTADEEAAYIREVAIAKTAALRMSLDALDRQHMPFVGETGGVGSGDVDRSAGAADPPVAPAADRPPGKAGLPTDPGLADRLLEARRRADDHLGHDVRRAPRPDKMRQ
jgi:hypothetical protein